MSSQRSTPLLVGLLLSALAVLLVLIVGSGEPEGDPDPVGLPTPTLVRPATGPDLEAEDLPGAELAPGIQRSELPLAAEGVRLAGEGRLTGRVVERASVVGLGDVRVDLLPLPPQGTDLIGRVLRLANAVVDEHSRVQPGLVHRLLPLTERRDVPAVLRPLLELVAAH